MALAAGAKVPPFEIFRGDGDPVGGDELWAEGPKLVLFFPFAFSGVTDG